MKTHHLQPWPKVNHVINFLLVGTLLICTGNGYCQEDIHSDRYAQMIELTLESHKKSFEHYKRRKVQRQLDQGQLNPADTVGIFSKQGVVESYVIPVKNDPAFKSQLEMSLEIMQSYDQWDLFSKLGRDTLDVLIDRIPNKAEKHQMSQFNSNIRSAELDGGKYFGHGFSSAIEISPNRYVIYHTYEPGKLSGYAEMILFSFSDKGEINIEWRHLMSIS